MVSAPSSPPHPPDPCISYWAGGNVDRQGNTEVICLCQKHRNSLVAAPGLEVVTTCSLASVGGEDVLLLWLPASAEEGLFSEGLMCTRCRQESLWVSTQGRVSGPAWGFPPSVAPVVIITDYSSVTELRAPTFHSISAESVSRHWLCKHFNTAVDFVSSLPVLCCCDAKFGIKWSASIRPSTCLSLLVTSYMSVCLTN